MTSEPYVLRSVRLPPEPLIGPSIARNHPEEMVDVTIEDGRIRSVDSARGGRPSMPFIDLEGSLLLPGFVDAHTHLGWAAESRWAVDWSHVDERPEATAILRAVADRVDDGFWILGGGWSRARLPDRALPLLVELDQAVPDRPLLLVSEDEDLAIVNSRALQLTRIDPTTHTPAGGAIERDETGRLTGRLRGTAARARMARGVVPPRDRYRELAEMRSLLREAAAMGITEMHDIATLPGLRPTPLIHEERSFTDATIFLDLAQANQLSARISIRPSLVRVEELSRRLRQFSRAYDLLGCDGFKLTIDNGGYRDRQDPAYSFRYPGFDASRRLMLAADRFGWPVSIHALGDRGVTEALDLFEAVARSAPRRPRIQRLVHARRVIPPDLIRIAELGVVVETQPWEIAGQGPSLDGRFPDSGATISPYRSMLELGIRLAFSSDWRVGMRPDLLDVEPLAGLYIAATRSAPTASSGQVNPKAWQARQRISPLEAVVAQVGGVRATDATSERGVIEPGSQADLVVLSADVTRQSPDALLEARVLGTIVAGDVVHLEGAGSAEVALPVARRKHRSNAEEGVMA